jgi:hypothetical protein
LPISRVISGVLLFAFGEQCSGAIEDLGALGSGDEAPGGEGFLGGGYGEGHVFGVRGRKDADDVGMIGGVDVLERLAAPGRQPFAADEIVIELACHEKPRFAG